MNKIRINAMSFALMLHELHDGATSAAELRVRTGLALSTIRDYIRELRKQKLVHIAGYDRSGINNCPSIILYQWNPGAKDARKPVMTAAEKSRRHRKRLRERAELHALTRVLEQGACA